MNKMFSKTVKWWWCQDVWCKTLGNCVRVSEHMLVNMVVIWDTVMS